MDTRSEKLSGLPLNVPISILASADVGAEGTQVTPYLKIAKSIKFMAKQDCLALSAAAIAVKKAGLTEDELKNSTGIYLTVGTLPFEKEHLNTLAENSETHGAFDMKRFSTDGYRAMSPMLTFKCLPNMPLFHISYNLDIHGPYCVTYPGPSQFFTVLERAIADLTAKRVRFAIVGAVADQKNFLVEHSTLRAGVHPVENLVDAASMLVLSLESDRSIGKLIALETEYSAVDPFETEYPQPLRLFETYSGPVEPVLAISRALSRASQQYSELSFSYEDGIRASITVEAT